MPELSVNVNSDRSTVSRTGSTRSICRSKAAMTSLARWWSSSPVTLARRTRPSCVQSTGIAPAPFFLSGRLLFRLQAGLYFHYNVLRRRILPLSVD